MQPPDGIAQCPAGFCRPKGAADSSQRAHVLWARLGTCSGLGHRPSCRGHRPAADKCSDGPVREHHPPGHDQPSVRRAGQPPQGTRVHVPACRWFAAAAHAGCIRSTAAEARGLAEGGRAAGAGRFGECEDEARFEGWCQADWQVQGGDRCPRDLRPVYARSSRNYGTSARPADASQQSSSHRAQPDPPASKSAPPPPPPLDPPPELPGGGQPKDEPNNLQPPPSPERQQHEVSSQAQHSAVPVPKTPPKARAPAKARPPTSSNGEIPRLPKHVGVLAMLFLGCHATVDRQLKFNPKFN